MLFGLMSHSIMFGPALGALLQPHDQPAHVTRWRLFRSCGCGRLRAACCMVHPDVTWRSK